MKKVSQSTDTTDDEVNTDILNSSSNPELGELERGREGHAEMFKSCEEIEALREDGQDAEGFEDVLASEEILCKELQGMIEKEDEAVCDTRKSE